MSAAPKAIDPRGSTRSRHLVNPWIIAAVVSLAAFMEVLDTAIANVALPYMAGGLAASVDDASWVLTSYLIANAVVLPISGWLSIRFGRKRSIARHVDSVSRYTGRWRWGAATGIASNLARHFSARAIGHRVCRVWNGDCGGAGDRPDRWRLDNG
jgi:DHA2 family multidrug resistance protein